MKKRRLISLLVLILLLVATPILITNFSPNSRRLTAAEKKEQITLFVTRLYHTSFDREPDDEGLDFWVDALLTQKVSGAEIADFFYTQEEFQNLNVTDSRFLDLLYRTFLDRGSDENGKLRWQVFLDSGCRREGILRAFLTCEEFSKLCKAAELEVGIIPARESRDENLYLTMFVFRLYREVLGRDSDISGINHWAGNVLNDNLTLAETASNFFFSEEFMQKNYDDFSYLQILYNAMMDRAPDEQGLQAWLSAMNDGMSREIVFLEFSESEEFQLICASYGLLDGTTPSIFPDPVSVDPTPAPDQNSRPDQGIITPPVVQRPEAVNPTQPNIVLATYKNNASIELLNRNQITAALTDVKFSTQAGAELVIEVENKSSNAVIIDFNAVVNGQQSLISWWYGAEDNANQLRRVPAGEKRTLRPNVATRNTSYQGDFNFPDMKSLELMVNVYSASGTYAYESPIFCSDLVRIAMSGTGNTANISPLPENTFFNQNGIGLSDAMLENSGDSVFLGAFVQNKGMYLTRIIVTGVKDEAGKELGNYLGDKQVYAIYNLFPNTGAYTRLALLNNIPATSKEEKIQLDFKIEYLNPGTGEKLDGGSYSTQILLKNR